MDSETTKRGPGRPPNAKPETAAEPAPTAEKLFPVLLLKNYKPRGKYEIVGEPSKPPYPGVGFEHKLWAGTTVMLPREEAVALLENQVKTTEKVIDDSGKVIMRGGIPMTQIITKKFPLAERADALPV